MPVFHFVCIDLMADDKTPGIEDVGQNKRYQDGNISHHLERKTAGATVGQRQRTLQVGHGRIISRMVIAFRQ